MENHLKTPFLPFVHLVLLLAKVVAPAKPYPAWVNQSCNIYIYKKKDIYIYGFLFFLVVTTKEKKQGEKGKYKYSFLIFIFSCATQPTKPYRVY